MADRRIWTKDDVKEVIVGHETYKKIEEKGELLFDVCHELGVSIMVSSDLKYGQCVTKNLYGDVIGSYDLQISH